MKNLTWQNPGQLFVAQELIKIVKLKCCGIKVHTEIGGEEICRKYPGISGNYGGFYQNIYEHLRLGEALQTGARDILNVIRVIEAAYQSQQEGKVISLK